MQIKVEKPTPETLEKMGVKNWPIWTCEPSKFDWTYDEKEVCYLLEGQVKVTAKNGEAATFGAGDMVTFAQNLTCVWEVSKAVRKHYKFG